ncbi:MAG: hypothetical protein Q8N52_03830 [Acidobacteriota bacterium]|nr:hypothetical protein [Acidobacteriota bacterium]
MVGLTNKFTTLDACWFDGPARTVNVKVPELVGVPDNRPALDSVIPDGRKLTVLHEQGKGQSGAVNW